MPNLEVPGELHDFFHNAGRSHDVIHSAEIEHRWVEELPGRSHEKFETFRTSSAYDTWKTPAEIELTNFRSRAKKDADNLSNFAKLEFKLNLKAVVGELGGALDVKVADLIRNLRNPSSGSEACQALAAEAQAIRDKAAGKTAKLSDEVLNYIAGERAVVQRRRMCLDQHFKFLETGAINEINRQLGKPHGDFNTPEVTELLDATSSIQEKLREWYQVLDEQPFPGDPQELVRKAEALTYELSELGRKTEDLAFRHLRNRTNPVTPDTPLLSGGLELQARLMAAEIGDQLAARVGNPTFTAVLRLANEHAEPVGGLADNEKTLVEKMRSNTNRAAHDWAAENVKQLTAARKHGLDQTSANDIATILQELSNHLENWRKAVDTAPNNGPAEVQLLAGEIMRRFRDIDRALIKSQAPEPYANNLRGLTDAAAHYIRQDATNGLHLLGG